MKMKNKIKSTVNDLDTLLILLLSLLLTFDFYCHFLLLLSNTVFYLVYLLFSILTSGTYLNTKSNLDRCYISISTHPIYLTPS